MCHIRVLVIANMTNITVFGILDIVTFLYSAFHIKPNSELHIFCHYLTTFIINCDKDEEKDSFGNMQDYILIPDVLCSLLFKVINHTHP